MLLSKYVLDYSRLAEILCPDITTGLSEKLTQSFSFINFNIGNSTFALRSGAYILDLRALGREVCELGISELSLGARLGPTVILGDSFIKEWYTHFDVANKRVGFAKAVQPSSVDLE